MTPAAPSGRSPRTSTSRWSPRTPRRVAALPPLSLQEATEDGAFWYVAAGDADIVAEIEAHPGVNASFAGKGSWLSVTGSARTSRDRADLERVWTPSAEAWFPQGIDTPGLVAVVIEGESAEYWDSPGKVATLIELATKRLRGQQPDPGDNETVEL
ncbi:pyridoxamine 5'-phosphate oxidase family protein [Litorihabitans aurantiacus]|uniref:pyridoxamine 5'-phosphate oxidase family protein n=1 Tax=Litorihabitans aurantiacus TaxID=1930061 RepID=UPI0032AEDE39